jgi:hypothetical protein
VETVVHMLLENGADPTYTFVNTSMACALRMGEKGQNVARMIAEAIRKISV